MAQYDSFARFYDAVNGEPTERITQVLAYIDEFHPATRSVLELGCGTGAVLAGLGSGLDLTGIDLSPAMLAVARRRCPHARLIEGDITTFELDERFDVVVCVYDTINHLTDFAQWQSLFTHVAAHLHEGGLFIFDLNPVGRLGELGDMAPWVYDFDGHTLIMDVDFSRAPIAEWNIRIFEPTGDDTFVRHAETILELGVPLDQVRAALASHYRVVAESDTRGATPTDESHRALFVARREAPATS